MGNIKYLYILAFDREGASSFSYPADRRGYGDELEDMWEKCDRKNTRRIKPDENFLITRTCYIHYPEPTWDEEMVCF